jgi:hypothetical protein
LQVPEYFLVIDVHHPSQVQKQREDRQHSHPRQQRGKQRDDRQRSHPRQQREKQREDRQHSHPRQQREKQRDDRHGALHEIPEKGLRLAHMRDQRYESQL